MKDKAPSITIHLFEDGGGSVRAVACDHQNCRQESWAASEGSPKAAVILALDRAFAARRDVPHRGPAREAVRPGTDYDVEL